MKKYLAIVGLVVASLMSIHSLVDHGWLNNIDAAKANAQEKGYPILLVFSGSDWCGNCIRLERKLFETEEFKAYAQDHLVLLNADFPMKKKNALPEDQQAHNDALAEKYNKEGKFPRVIMMDATGKVLDELSHPHEDLETYMSELKKMVNSN